MGEHKHISVCHPEKILLAAMLAVLIVASINALLEFFPWILYEWHGSYTADTPLYWAVGRGILNGLNPYRDLFESKPPGIFLISALSFWLTGDTTLTSMMQALVILSMPVIFAVCTLFHTKEHHCLHRIFLVLLAAVFGAIIGLYASWRSGQVQVESFGAMFACLYIATILGGSPTMTWKRILLASTWMLLSIGLKEPFLLSMFAGALVLHHSPRTLARTFVVPLLIAIVAGLTVMAIVGYLPSYITIYLDELIGRYIHGIGQGGPLPPLWERGLGMAWLFHDLNNYSRVLGFSIASLIIAKLLSMWHLRRGMRSILVGASAVIIALYITTVAVGMGGQWYNHHYVFALPLYAALFLSFVVYARNHWQHVSTRATTLLILMLLTATTFLLPEYDRKADLISSDNNMRQMKTIAANIDGILDACGGDRYLFLGHNGLQPYAYTEHSPLGPLFFQNGYLLDEHRPFFRQGFIHALDRARLIVFHQYYLADLTEYTDQYIRDHFSRAPWPCAAPIHPSEGPYTFFYRTRQ